MGRRAAFDTGNVVDCSNSGGLKCGVLKKWTIPILIFVHKENRNVFKSLYCK